MRCKRLGIRGKTGIRQAVTMALAIVTGLVASPLRGDDPRWAEQAGLAFWGVEPPPPHRIIRPPAPLAEQASPWWRGSLGTPETIVHGGHVAAVGRDVNRRGRWWPKPEPATIPDAIVEPVWRNPYSYGYFGAGRDRHWQRHFGSRQAFTQWTLK